MITPLRALIGQVPFLRDYILQLVASDPALRTPAIVAWLESLPAGSAIALYGCGTVAEAVVLRHREALDRHRITFLMSEAGPGVTFHGYPVIEAAHVRPGFADHIAILSVNHEPAMLRRLSGFDRTAIHTVAELIRRYTSDDRLAATAADLVRTADTWAARLEGRLPESGLSGLFLLHSLGHHQLDFLRELRERGMFVVALIHAFAGIPDGGEVRAAGCVDEWLVANSYEESAVLAFLLLGRLDFSFFDAWMFQGNGALIRFLIDSLPRRIVVTYDDFLELMLENGSFARHFSAATGISREAALDTQRAVFTRASGIIYKDSPKAIDELAARYHHRPRAIQKFPVTERRPLRGHEPGSPLRVVFAHSCWKEERYQTYVKYEDILETVRILTRAGVHFTIFNNVDVNGLGFEDLMAMSRENPLFEYHFHVPFEELLERLPQYDFGWASYRLDASIRDDAHVKYTLGLKLFTYANAGLPTLVSPELEFMSGFVAEKGIGLPVSFEDWPRLPEIAATGDYAQMRRNTQALCAELDVSHQAARMFDFYRNVAAQPPGRSVPSDRPVVAG